MRSLVLRTIGALVAAGIGLGVAAAPASAAGDNTLDSLVRETGALLVDGGDQTRI
ncbi:hypothetical protein [Paractinoplanes hotanensis]|uniref:Uncharacterized protein n=1 Tax=Paractinoplanes hotanensis TaxID=2906497 RepID=A0ABT0XRS3_9ACTN|nr:hypothetical protein [Actinoplanes hotanensis]MCM4076463.1 hypothetical protein [Actinoplanes hotanensis]